MAEYVTVPITRNMFDALVSFTYNWIVKGDEEAAEEAITCSGAPLAAGDRIFYCNRDGEALVQNISNFNVYGNNCFFILSGADYFGRWECCNLTDFTITNMIK